jgi:uncharacterized membrane protein YtjA (UPF0391 family)
MLRLAIVFLVIAAIAGLLNLTGIEGTALHFAQVVFFLFLVLFAASLILGLVNDRSPAPPPV